MASWADLLPSASAVLPSALIAQAGVPGFGEPPAAANGNGSVISGGFGVGRFIEVGQRALGAYRAWQGAPVHPGFDVSRGDDPDDMEVAKMIAQYGAIPAASDLGALAIQAGARTYRQPVRFADGSRAVIDVVQVGSRRGGADRPEGAAPQSRRKQLTSYRLGTAAWVMRKLHAQQKLGRRFASLAKQLYPSPRPSAKRRR